MSAAEIIALIKKLPPTERAEVIAFARATDESASAAPTVEESVRHISAEEVERLAPKVFAEHRELFRKLAQ